MTPMQDNIVKTIAKKWAADDHQNAMAGSRAPLEYVIEQAIREYAKQSHAAIWDEIEGYIDGAPDATATSRLANRISSIIGST